MIYAYADKVPRLAPACWVAPSATVIGDVVLEDDSSVWWGAVLRAEEERILVGMGSNVQDNAVLHVDPGYPLTIGANVTIGHLAMVHGCILHDRAFVGLGAIVMDGCEIESDATLAAGAMLTPGKRIPSGQLWAGRPAKYVRDLTPQELAGQQAGVRHYVELAKAHAEALRTGSLQPR